MKLFIIYWRALGGASGEIYCRAANPSQAVTHFRKVTREHGKLDGVIVTGIAEDRGQLSLRMVQA